MEHRSLQSYYQPGHFALSFEVFPPKTQKSTENLYGTVKNLSQWNPSFISVTYGAGGSTRSQSLELLEELKKRLQVPLTAHLTCVGSTVEEIRDWLKATQLKGVENIMALRGDPPQGQKVFTQVQGGLRHASELVSLIRNEFPQYGVGVAGYPEKHREATSQKEDLQWLKHKVDQGANAIFTQLFYQNEDFFKFRAECEHIGIRVPIIPGILPISSLEQVTRVTQLCGASVPEALSSRLKACGNNLERQLETGIAFAVEQCQELIAKQVPGIHFYVLNRSDIINKILSQLQIPKA